MSDLIRNVDLNDIDKIIKINELSVPAVNSISRNKFEWFIKNSIYFKLIESSSYEIKGFLLALNQEINYESLNYKWFKQRNKKFVYVDRIAILDKFKRIGLGRMLYQDLETSVKSDYDIITCEYNLKPMNYESEKFHKSTGFMQVGELITDSGNKEVALMLKEI